MVAAVSESPIDSLIKKNSKMAASTSDGTRVAISDVYPKVAVRYLLQRTQRFSGNFSSVNQRDDDKDQEKQKRIDDKDSSKDRLIERLRYLGLAPRKYSTSEGSSSSKRKRYSPKKLPQNIIDNDEFVRPQILECDYCTKIFFNKNLHRRHTITHLRTRRCTNCNQPFKDKISHRRHQVHCNSRLHYKSYEKKINELSMFE